MTDKFKKIDDLNKTLENINKIVYTTFNDIENYPTQQKVDEACEFVNNKTNPILNEKREELIKVLHEAYLSSNEVITLLKPLVEFDLNIDTVVEAVKKIINILAGPYKIAVEYITVLTPKLQDLMINIALLAYIPENIPQRPDINYDKLKISMKPITINEIITGNTEEDDTENPDADVKIKRQVTFKSYNDLLASSTEYLKNGDFSFVVYKFKKPLPEGSFTRNKYEFKNNTWYPKFEIYDTKDKMLQDFEVGNIYRTSDSNFVLCTDVIKKMVDSKYVTIDVEYESLELIDFEMNPPVFVDIS